MEPTSILFGIVLGAGLLMWKTGQGGVKETGQAICVLGGLGMLAVLLTGCAAVGGQPYTPQAMVQGQNQIVVYRVSRGAILPISVNGQERCQLPNGGSFVFNVPINATVNLDIKKFGFMPSSHMLVADRPKIFIRVQYNTGLSLLSGALAGVSGLPGAAAGASLDPEGEWLFRTGSEAEASQTNIVCR